MKTIQDFTIYCTESQTKKAFELGVPIKTEINYTRTGSQFKGIYNDGKTFYYLPTAEQMIEWLEEKKIFVSVLYGYDIWDKWSYDIDSEIYIEYKKSDAYSSRREATIAAIDAALECITHNKK